MEGQGATTPVLQSSEIPCSAPQQHPEAQLSLWFGVSAKALSPRRSQDPLTETQLLCCRGGIISRWPFPSAAHDNCSRLGQHGARMLVMKCFRSSTLIIPLHYRALPQGPSKESRLSSFPAETKTRPPNKLHWLEFSLSPCSGGAWSCSFSSDRSGRTAPAQLRFRQPANPQQTKQSACPQPGAAEAAATPEVTTQACACPRVPSTPQPPSATLRLLLTCKGWPLTTSKETALSIWLLNSLLFLPILR